MKAEVLIISYLSFDLQPKCVQKRKPWPCGSDTFGGDFIFGTSISNFNIQYFNISNEKKRFPNRKNLVEDLLWSEYIEHFLSILSCHFFLVY